LYHEKFNPSILGASTYWMGRVDVAERIVCVLFRAGFLSGQTSAFILIHIGASVLLEHFCNAFVKDGIAQNVLVTTAHKQGYHCIYIGCDIHRISQLLWLQIYCQGNKLIVGHL
jgi:hypothetical protein